MQIVLRRFADHAVEPVVPGLVLPPGGRGAAPLQAKAHFGDVIRRGVQGGESGDLRLEQHARAHDLAGIGFAGDRRDVADPVHRPASR